MSVKTQVAGNPLLAAFAAVIEKLVWAGYEDVKDVQIPVHIHVFGIPVSLNVKVSDLRTVLEVITGETEAEALAAVSLGSVELTKSGLAAVPPVAQVVS